MALIELTKISKVYHSGESNQVVALKNVDLVIESGEMCAISGTSGAGKSTLLNILGCLDKPTSGYYKLNGTEINALSDRALSEMRNSLFGHIMQNYGLLENLSVYDNIKIPLIFSKCKPREYKNRIKKVLTSVNLEGFENKPVKELSGGQSQRVAIARALVNSPTVLFADEPTGSLDSENTKNIMRLFRAINKTGVTVIIVTHDDEVASFCDRKIVICDGQIVERA